MHSFGPRLQAPKLFSDSMFRDKMSLPLALIPFSGWVHFPDSEPEVRLLRGIAGIMDSMNLWGPRPLTRQLIQEAMVTPKRWQEEKDKYERILGSISKEHIERQREALWCCLLVFCFEKALICPYLALNSLVTKDDLELLTLLPLLPKG